ncbi:MAG: TetR family transcriptional regulator [Acidimicrobiales bacterium]|nr:TetR family transcriptional regulator [Acidimicrobiales bacterium]
MSEADERPIEGEDELRAADGRMPGRRGLATRQKLLEHTLSMLEASSYRELKVIDIAREAGTSPATFYQYFPDVESAILVLAQDAAHDGAVLTEIATAGPWKGPGGYDTAGRLVDAFFEFWDSHQSVMRVVDLATAQGDDRFRQIRVRLLNDIASSLAQVVRHFVSTKQLPDGLDPMAQAGVVVSMLAHVSDHQMGFEFWGIKTKNLRVSMARQVYWTITGQKPPAP